MKLSRRDTVRLGLSFAGTLMLYGPEASSHSAVEVDASQVEALRGDAEIAWRFFADRRGVDKGLVPAATWPEGDNYGRYDILTMWDTGSLILANICARSIGLIDNNEFDERIKAAMAFVRRSEFKWKQLTLPNYRTGNRGGSIVEPGYDATDTGRLLIALYILDRVTNGAYRAKQQVERWNLSDTIIGGRLQDIKGSSKGASQCFNYVYYVARAYGLWGLEVKTGFDQSLTNDAEEAAAFLEHVSKVGPIASEPCATEAIELGHSDESRILADTLYAAQKQRYEETGHLTCVSEAPIDQPPWFTYQGYNIDSANGPRWPVDAAVTERRWQTDEFADKFRMISSKAAYLWYAERGDDYARKVRALVRQKAPSEKYGFRSGIYERSGRPPNLMDVNTNAAVLEAVAYVLSGRKPLSEITL